MRIVFLNPLFYPYMGGTEKHLYEIGKRLAKKHEVYVVTSHLKDTKLEDEVEKMRVKRTRGIILYHLPSFLPPPMPFPLGLREKIEEIRREGEVDLLHTHNRFCPYYLSVIEYKEKHKLPLFTTLHNARPKTMDPMTDFFGQLYDEVLGKRMIAKADALISNSQYTYDVTASFYKKTRTVIHNGIDTNYYRPRENSIKEKHGIRGEMILFVGRLLPQKGVEYLIKAFKIIKKSHPDARLVVVGRGPEKKRLEEISPEGVIFTGFVPEKELPLYYAACDVSVVPSVWEPFGIVVLEGMSTGKPVVASKTGGIPEIIRHGEDGFLFENTNHEDLAEKILHVLEHDVSDVAKKAREKCVKEFDWDIIAEKTEAFYKKTLTTTF